MCLITSSCVLITKERRRRRALETGRDWRIEDSINNPSLCHNPIIVLFQKLQVFLIILYGSGLLGAHKQTLALSCQEAVWTAVMILAGVCSWWGNDVKQNTRGWLLEWIVCLDQAHIQVRRSGSDMSIKQPISSKIWHRSELLAIYVYVSHARKYRHTRSHQDTRAWMSTHMNSHK